jgi:hypothetical protein
LDLSSVVYRLPRGWRIPSESGGGMNHIGVALSIIFEWRLASEYAIIVKDMHDGHYRHDSVAILFKQPEGQSLGLKGIHCQ